MEVDIGFSMREVDPSVAKAAVTSAPHCDPKVLHAPGKCWACDLYPEWQRARKTWKINFTGENIIGHELCPAERHRPLEVIEEWKRNRATR